MRKANKGKPMKPSLKPGIAHVLRYTVAESKTVPRLYPESDIIRNMPPVFATGFMIGLMEWACTEAIRPHLDAGEGSVGTLVNVTHSAATPIGMEVEVTARCTAVDGRRLTFEVTARDEVDVIGQGTHGRHVVDWARFNQRLAEKAGRGT